jgi:hypothetical protein
MRLCLIGFSLAVLFGAALVRPQAVGATIGPCCGEGINLLLNGAVADYGTTVHVSDGTTITTTVNIWDTPQSTTGISYTVHVPLGKSVSDFSFQGSTLVGQSLNVVADQPPYQYEVDTVVGDASNVWVDTTTNATNDGIGLYRGATDSGTANSAIATTPSSG